MAMTACPGRESKCIVQVQSKIMVAWEMHDHAWPLVRGEGDGVVGFADIPDCALRARGESPDEGGDDWECAPCAGEIIGADVAVDGGDLATGGKGVREILDEPEFAWASRFGDDADW